MGATFLMSYPSAGWTIRGDIHLVNELNGAPDPLASLASRFVLEVRGRLHSDRKSVV